MPAKRIQLPKPARVKGVQYFTKRSELPPSNRIRHSNTPLLNALLGVADEWARHRSKGRTKVGAVVYHEPSGAMFLGYNGFPRGVPDREDWWTNPVGKSLVITKHDLVVHAEANAVRKAIAGLGTTDLSGCVMACTMMPCSRCVAQEIAHHGIRRIVYCEEDADMLTLHDRMVTSEVCKAARISMERIQL